MFFRDRHIVIYSVALPAFLYPALFIGLLQLATYVRGVEERRVSSVSVGGGVAADALRRFVEGRDKESEVDDQPRMKLTSPPEGVIDEHRARELISHGNGPPASDAVVVVRRADSSVPLETDAPIDVDVYYSEARGSSTKARDRVEGALDDWRHDRLLQTARELGEAESFLEPLTVESVSLSTPEELANYAVGLILPLMMIMMTAVGAFYPALDSTVGEKERGSLETTLLAPVHRSVIVHGKYLAVMTAALFSFGVNFLSMTVTVTHLSVQFPVESFHLTLWAFVVILSAAVLLAAFLSAVMMLLAFLARSFKEGQSYVTPIYLLLIVPIAVTTDPDLGLSPGLAVVPLVNSTLLFRDSLGGTFDPLCVALTLTSSAVYALLALWVSAKVLSREEVLTGGEVPLTRVLGLLFKSRREEVSP